MDDSAGNLHHDFFFFIYIYLPEQNYTSIIMYNDYALTVNFIQKIIHG